MRFPTTVPLAATAGPPKPNIWYFVVDPAETSVGPTSEPVTPVVGSARAVGARAPAPMRSAGMSRRAMANRAAGRAVIVGSTSDGATSDT